MLLRGLLEDVELFEWLATMWRLKQNFDHETLYWASMCGLAEMARAGVTCFNEHSDAYAVTPQIRALADFDGAIEAADDLDPDRVRLALSPHAPYSCSEAMWRAVRELADDRALPIHTHVAEGLREQDYMAATYGRTTVQWLDDIGLLGADITAAHCTQLSATHVAPVYDVEAALVYGSRADDVTHTIVGGEVVFDGEVIGVDEERVTAKFVEHARDLLARSNS